MKKLLCILLLSAYPAIAWVGWDWTGWQWGGSNGVGAATVHAGVNNIYDPVMAAEIGQTNNDGTFLVTIDTVYSPLYITNELGEVIEADDVSPKLKVNFQQIVHVTNGVITLGKRTYNNSVIGAGWYGANLSTNVGISLMTSTNGAYHQMTACFFSDGTRSLPAGGELYFHTWTNYPTQPKP